MLGYAANSAPNVYRFLDMETKKIVHSRDVMWLGYKFYENSLPMTSAPEDNHEEEEEIVPVSEDEDEGGIVTTTYVTSSDSKENTVERRQTRSQGYSASPIPTVPRAIRAVAKLSEFNESPDDQAGREERATLFLDRLFDECMLFSKEEDVNDVEPKDFKEAWHHPIPEVRENGVKLYERSFLI